MMNIRPSRERGLTQIDWLKSRHTFSFDTYVDPTHDHFRTLRVINEDIVKPGAGFHPHSHRDMEIITYLLSGALEHKDSMGNGSVIRPGEIQRMTAGTGVTHSEFNASQKEPAHLLQIWIFPDKKGLSPGYEQKKFERKSFQNRFCLLASRDAQQGSVRVRQDVWLYGSMLKPKQNLAYSLNPGRHAWVQVASGELELNGKTLTAGDGAAASDEKDLQFTAKKDSEFLLFDLA